MGNKITTIAGQSIDSYADYKEGASQAQIEAFIASAKIPLAGKYSASDTKASTKSVPLNEVLGGGGSGGLPEITPADEGKFLKVESGAAAWGEGSGGDDGETVTIDLGNYYNYAVNHTGEPVDVSDVWTRIFSAVWDDKKVRVTILFADAGILAGYIDTDGMLFTVLPQIKASGAYTKEQAVAELMAVFTDPEYKDMAAEYYGFKVYTEGLLPEYASTFGLK